MKPFRHPFNSPNRKATTMFWLIVTISWSLFLWDFYLSHRQYRVQKNAIKRPTEATGIISEEDYAKARLYAIDKHEFNLALSIYSQIENTITQSIIFASVTAVIETVLGLPWEYYLTFVIEEKHGFNKQTVPFFFKDKLKKLVVTTVIMAPILAAIIFIVEHGGPYFFVYVWIFLSLMIFVIFFYLVLYLQLLLTIYPEFIAPLFDKYVPLPDGELRTKIVGLAKKVNFPLTKIWVVQGSKRSAHSNAYMYGFWKNKRIVLYDTLLNEETNSKLKKLYNEVNEKNATKPNKLGTSDDEVVAVLGHELGHWSLSHSIYNLIITEANLLLLLVMFSYFYKARSLYEAFGFHDSTPTIIGLIIVFQFITAPYNEIISFLITMLTRRMEFAADAYSVKLGYGEKLCSALIKLGKDNLSLPVNDHLYSLFNHSHPPILERIQAARKMQ
uniref:CAAX prenyl protease n=1 Tax=Syphacia muris TaxID=451379 RepID=A0A0N5ALC2_9BILA